MNKFYIAPRTEKQTIESPMIMQTVSPFVSTNEYVPISDEEIHWGN